MIKGVKATGETLFGITGAAICAHAAVGIGKRLVEDSSGKGGSGQGGA